jgi:hypothetical protein
MAEHMPRAKSLHDGFIIGLVNKVCQSLQKRTSLSKSLEYHETTQDEEAILELGKYRRALTLKALQNKLQEACNILLKERFFKNRDPSEELNKGALSAAQQIVVLLRLLIGCLETDMASTKRSSKAALNPSSFGSSPKPVPSNSGKSDCPPQLVASIMETLLQLFKGGDVSLVVPTKDFVAPQNPAVLLLSKVVLKLARRVVFRFSINYWEPVFNTLDTAIRGLVGANGDSKAPSEEWELVTLNLLGYLHINRPRFRKVLKLLADVLPSFNKKMYVTVAPAISQIIMQWVENRPFDLLQVYHESENMISNSNPGVSMLPGSSTDDAEVSDFKTVIANFLKWNTGTLKKSLISTTVTLLTMFCPSIMHTLFVEGQSPKAKEKKNWLPKTKKATTVVEDLDLFFKALKDALISRKSVEQEISVFAFTAVLRMCGMWAYSLKQAGRSSWCEDGANCGEGGLDLLPPAIQEFVLRHRDTVQGILFSGSGGGAAPPADYHVFHSSALSAFMQFFSPELMKNGSALHASTSTKHVMRDLIECFDGKRLPVAGQVDSLINRLDSTNEVFHLELEDNLDQQIMQCFLVASIHMDSHFAFATLLPSILGDNAPFMWKHAGVKSLLMIAANPLSVPGIVSAYVHCSPRMSYLLQNILLGHNVHMPDDTNSRSTKWVKDVANVFTSLKTAAPTSADDSSECKNLRQETNIHLLQLFRLDPQLLLHTNDESNRQEESSGKVWSDIQAASGGAVGGGEVAAEHQRDLKRFDLLVSRMCTMICLPPPKSLEGNHAQDKDGGSNQPAGLITGFANNGTGGTDYLAQESLQRQFIAVEALRTLRTLHFPQWITRLSTKCPLEGYLQLKNCALAKLEESISYDGSVDNFKANIVLTAMRSLMEFGNEFLKQQRTMLAIKRKSADYPTTLNSITTDDLDVDGGDDDPYGTVTATTKVNILEGMPSKLIMACFAAVSRVETALLLYLVSAEQSVSNSAAVCLEAFCNHRELLGMSHQLDPTYSNINLYRELGRTCLSVPGRAAQQKAICTQLGQFKSRTNANEEVWLRITRRWRQYKKEKLLPSLEKGEDVMEDDEFAQWKNYTAVIAAMGAITMTVSTTTSSAPEQAGGKGRGADAASQFPKRGSTKRASGIPRSGNEPSRSDTRDTLSMSDMSAMSDVSSFSSVPLHGSHPSQGSSNLSSSSQSLSSSSPYHRPSPSSPVILIPLRQMVFYFLELMDLGSKRLQVRDTDGSSNFASKGPLMGKVRMTMIYSLGAFLTPPAVPMLVEALVYELERLFETEDSQGGKLKMSWKSLVLVESVIMIMKQVLDRVQHDCDVLALAEFEDLIRLIHDVLSQDLYTLLADGYHTVGDAIRVKKKACDLTISVVMVADRISFRSVHIFRHNLIGWMSEWMSNFEGKLRRMEQPYNNRGGGHDLHPSNRTDIDGRHGSYDSMSPSDKGAKPMRRLSHNSTRSMGAQKARPSSQAAQEATFQTHEQYELDIMCMHVVASLMNGLDLTNILSSDSDEMTSGQFVSTSRRTSVSESQVKEYEKDLFRKYFSFLVDAICTSKKMTTTDGGGGYGMMPGGSSFIMMNSTSVHLGAGGTAGGSSRNHAGCFLASQMHHQAVEALLNLLRANLDVGFGYLVNSAAYHADDEARSAFLRVLTVIVQEHDTVSSLKQEDEKSNSQSSYEDNLMDLSRLLTDPENIFLTAAVTISITKTSEMESVAKNLVEIFENSPHSNNRRGALRLVCEVISREVAKTTRVETLFRNSSMGSHLISLYAKRKGSDFLRATLLPCIESIQGDAFASHEVDPNKLRPGEDLEANFETLQNSAGRFLNSIIQSASRCPSELKALCEHLYSEVTNQFPAQRSGHIAVAGFLFLRFFCPVIVAPTQRGILKRQLEQGERRALVFITKALQNLANGVHFKESYMAPMNDWLDSRAAEVKKYCSKMAHPSEFDEMAPDMLPPATDDFHDDGPPDSTLRALVEIHRLIHNRQGQIFKKMNDIETDPAVVPQRFSSNRNRHRAVSKSTVGSAHQHSLLGCESPRTRDLTKSPLSKSILRNSHFNTSMNAMHVRHSSGGIGTVVYQSAKNISEAMEQILRQLGPPQVSGIEQSTIVQLSSQTEYGPRLDAFMQKMDKQCLPSLRRNTNATKLVDDFEKLQSKKVFYKNGTSKKGHAVFYFITRRATNDIDKDMLLYLVLRELKACVGKPFELVLDSTQFDEKENEFNWVKWKNLIPVSWVQKCAGVYIIQPSPDLKVLSRRIYKTLQITSKERKLVTFLSRASHLADYILKPVLPKETFLENDTKLNWPVLYNHKEGSIAITSKFLWLETSDHTVFGIKNTTQHLLIPLPRIKNVTNLDTQAGFLPVLKDQSRAPVTIKFGQPEAIVVFVDKQAHKQVLGNLRRAVSRHLQQSALLSDQGGDNVRTFVSSEEIPGILLHVSLLNLGSIFPATRQDAYNLLVALQKRFNLAGHGTALGSGAIVVPHGMPLAVNLSKQLATSEHKLTLDFLREALRGFKTSAQNTQQMPMESKFLCIQCMLPWFANLKFFCGVCPHSGVEKNMDEGDINKMSREIIKNVNVDKVTFPFLSFFLSFLFVPSIHNLSSLLSIFFLPSFRASTSFLPSVLSYPSFLPLTSVHVYIRPSLRPCRCVKSSRASWR